jgi:parallel beta-helix repeat protein
VRVATNQMVQPGSHVSTELPVLGTGSGGNDPTGIWVRGKRYVVRRHAALLLLVGFSVVAACRPQLAAASCAGQSVAPGQDLAAVVHAAAAGSTFCLSAGTYRITTPVAMRSGDRLIGVSGTVISGGRIVSDWTPMGSEWVAAGAPTTPTDAGQGSFPSLRYRQAMYGDDLFLDGRPLWKAGVEVGGAVIGIGPDQLGPGEYFVDYDTGQFLLGTDPSGHMLETAVAPAGIVAAGASGVTIQSVAVREFTGDAIDAGREWRIRRANISLAVGTGVRLTSGSVLSGSTVLDNGRYGVTGAGRDVAVTGDVISRNNYHRWSTERGGPWDAGGTKFVLTTNLRVDHCTVARNYGNGIWLDIDNYESRVMANRVGHNTQIGIDHEISYRAVIAGNTVAGNGSYGIYVSASPDDTVRGNSLHRNRGEIVLRQSRRPQHPSAYGPHIVSNTNVYGNLIDLRSPGTWVGGFQTVGSDAMFTRRSNRFHDNRILHTARATVVRWLDHWVTLGRWRAYGQW